MATNVNDHALVRDGASNQLAALRAENARLRSSVAQLQASEQRFRLLAETMPQLVWTCLPDGQCDYLGPQWVEYTGTPEAEQLGYGWLERLHPDDRGRANAEWSRCAAAGVALDIDFRIRRWDGAHRCFKTRALPVRDAAGNIVLWLGTNTDIEDMRRAEAEIRRLSEGLEREVAQRTAELASVSERLTAATRAANIGIWDWDIESDRIVWNEGTRHLVGLDPWTSPRSILDWQANVHGEDREALRQALERALSGGEPFDVTFRILRAGGEIRHYHAVATVHRDASGRPVRLLGVNWDITREVVAGERLRISEERWNLALQGTGDGVWDWDVLADQAFLSHRSKELLGYDADTQATADFRSTLIHPDDRERTREAMEAHLSGKTPAFRSEYRMRRRDGTYVWILARGRVITRDAEGRPLRVVGTHKDVEDRRQAQEALQNREALLREFIKHTPAAIAMLDRDMRYIQASRRWLTDYKLDGEDIAGRSHYEVFPDIPDRWKEIHQRVLQGAVEACEEDPFPRADGALDWLQWEARPWHDAAGNVGGLIFFTQVITERKELGLKLEEQNRLLSESNAELEQFAYVASHDLQEPLRAVAGCTQILAQRYRGQLGEDADALMGHIVGGATRMKTLIEDLLRLSRVTSQKEEPSWLNASDVVAQALRNLATSIQETDALVHVEDLPRLRADATQLLQLFQNLVGNALKYRSDRRPEVHVSARGLADGAHFSVRDNGIGIEAQYFERIFGVFQRLHTREEYAGTGIGLAICKKIVERHRGRIWLESVPGSGTTFHFTLRN